MTNVTIQNLPTPSVPNTVATPTPNTAPAPSVSSPKVSANVAAPVNNVRSAGETTQAEDVGTPSVTRNDLQPQPNSSLKTAISNSSNIMTYRDSESGQLVVRLVDENNNAVISQFPSKTMLGNYPKLVTSSDMPKINTEA